jgi:hypothetical protein
MSVRGPTGGALGNPKEWAHASWSRAGPDGDVQVLWKETIAADRYVADRGWEGAILCECPLHPQGGCGLGKLGTYGRVRPQGVRVARFWCPRAGVSISLLPAFLAARLSGTLDAVEAVVLAVEQAGSIAAAVEVVHPADAERAIGAVCAMRSIRRRVRAVGAALLAVITLLPERFVGVAPTLSALRQFLGTDRVLVALRAIAHMQLGALPVPLGLGARVKC